MADNPFVRLRKAVAGYKNALMDKIREATSKLTERQSRIILAVLFAVFVTVDVIYIVRGFRGESASQIEIEHLRQVEIETQKPIQNDTIPEYAPGQ